jgi:hypothetical protein
MKRKQKINDKRRILRRYTKQKHLMSLLRSGKISFLSPALWADRNDAFFVNQYKKHMQLKSVLLLCFTMGTEKFHHWRVFAKGRDGVRIEFKHNAFDPILQQYQDHVRAGEVKYKKIATLRKRRPKVEQLPFLKRQPYSDEEEFRICYVDDKQALKTKVFTIDLDSILRITLSPCLPENQVAAIRANIHAIPGCKYIKVSRSTLLENEAWKRVAERRIRRR